MNNPARPLLPEALLAHEAFVHALARNLLRSDEPVDDLVQDTWLTALAHPPRSAHSARAFLGTVVRNLVRNLRRGSAARTQREQFAARDESIESVAAVQERLAVQRAVVDAVLTLQEPYRGVLLLHYYENCSAGEIARSRGVPAGTVRAQLSRGLRMLRAKLDGEFGGNRDAWSAALIPWLTRGARAAPAAGATSPVGLLGVALLIAAAVPIAWLVLRDRVPRTAGKELADLASLPHSAANSTEDKPGADFAQAKSQTRTAVLPSPSSAPVSTRPDLDAKSMDELLTLEVQAARTLEKRLWTPDPGIVAAQKELLALPGTGVARLLTPFGKSWNLDSHWCLPLGYDVPRYLRHAVRNHIRAFQPEFELNSEGKLKPGSDKFGERSCGFAAGVGDASLVTFSALATPVPTDANDQNQATWRLCCSQPSWFGVREAQQFEDPSDASVRALADSYAREVQALRADVRDHRLDALITPRVGDTFLFRQVDGPPEVSLVWGRDILAVVRILQCDADEITIGWRLLRTWAIWPPNFPDGELLPGQKRSPPALFPNIPAAPASIEALSVEELTALIHDVRASATTRLLRVPQEFEKKYAVALEQPDTSLIRFLFQSRCSLMFDPAAAGLSYPIEALVGRTSRGMISPEGGWVIDPRGEYVVPDGWILDLGRLPVSEAPLSAGLVPPTLDALQREAWRLMWFTEQEQWTEARNERNHQVGKRLEPAIAEVGHTYMIRARLRNDPLPNQSSVLASFTTVDRDEDGETLLLRSLKTFSLPSKVAR